MKFRLYLLSAFVFCAACAQAEDKLNLFIWSEYLPDDVARDFEKRFNCKLVIDLYEESEAMLAKIQNGGASIYDVTMPSNDQLPLMIREKLIAPLRKNNIPNFKNIDERFLNPSFDPENRYSLPYQWGTLGIFARKIDGKPIHETWGLFFDPKLQPGPFVLIDSRRDLIGAALKYKGYSFNSTDQKQLREARDLLIDAKKRSSGFATSVGGRLKVIEKSAAAAIVYSSGGVLGTKEDPETHYFIPVEGSEIYVDTIAVLAQAPHRDLAEKFINFVLEPEISARISNSTSASSPNSAAKKFIDPAMLNHPGVYPNENTMRKLEYLVDLGKNTRLYDQLWTSIKAR